MLARFQRIRPGRPTLRKVGLAAFVAAVAALAFFWGRHGAPSATAQTPFGARADMGGNALPSDYDKRVVAFIHGNIPITREELGEYLIARLGPERVEYLVNRRIIEMACQAHHITVADAEVDAQLKADIDSFGGTISMQDFVDKILKRYNKTLYEWREDVIRPKLALSKFVQGQITVTEEDIQKAFEAHFGEKIKCRMIAWPAKMEREVIYQIEPKIKKSEEEFDKEAKQQFIPELAMRGGEIPLIHKHFTDPTIEQAAFALRTKGEVSKILTMPDKSLVILKLVERVPPDTKVNRNEVRPALHKEMAEYKLQQAIPKYFQELRAQARPNILLKREPSRTDVARHPEPQFNMPARVPGMPAGN